VFVHSDSIASSFDDRVHYSTSSLLSLQLTTDHTTVSWHDLRRSGQGDPSPGHFSVLTIIWTLKKLAGDRPIDLGLGKGIRNRVTELCNVVAGACLGRMSYIPLKNPTAAFPLIDYWSCRQTDLLARGTYDDDEEKDGDYGKYVWTVAVAQLTQFVTGGQQHCTMSDVTDDLRELMMPHDTSCVSPVSLTIRISDIVCWLSAEKFKTGVQA